MIVKAKSGIKGKVRRNIACCHDGNGGEILIIFEDCETSPDGDEQNHQQEKDEPLARQKRKTYFMIFSIKHDHGCQAAQQASTLRQARMRSRQAGFGPKY